MVNPGGKERNQVPAILDTKSETFLANKPPGPSSSQEPVTLTKSQLRAIIVEAIGVGALNINEVEEELVAGRDEVVLPKNVSNAHKTKIHESNSSCTDSLPTSHLQDCLQAQCPLDAMFPDTQQKILSPTKVSAISRLEQKRLQWEKEKAEMLDWNPWGKPGAGAPTRRTLPVASVAPNQLSVQTNSVPYSISMPNGIPSCHTSPSHYRSAVNVANPDASCNSKTFTNLNCNTQSVNQSKPVPPVFKSSIKFGTIDDDSNYYESLKNQQQWLKDLGQQREELRVKRITETERYNQIPDGEWLNGNVGDIDSISISVEGSVAPCPADGRTHVRGQGFKMDPTSAANAEERRAKAQQNQQAIRMQIEEKQRQLQLAKEKKKQEEEEEERRLVAERARLNADYEREQRQMKHKKDIEEQKQTAIISAIHKAEDEAKADKVAKKSSKVQMTGDAVNRNEVSSPRKTPGEAVSPRMQPKGAKSKEEKQDSETSKTAQQTATVHPLQNSTRDSNKNIENSPCKEFGIQTILPSHVEDHTSGYIVNRVLTPSLVRMKMRGGGAGGKDFGTQTDMNYGRWIGDDAESTDQSNTSSICAPTVKRLNRIQHSKPYKASRRQFSSDVEYLTDRPKWGVNQPSKSYVRMTDRDPHFTKRKKLQEMRKQHWEREMASQQAIRNAQRSNPAYPVQSQSHPNLRLRRTRSSSDGTAGFSSSEFETSQAYGNSFPRNRQSYHVRSVCGSADDVAYFGPSSAYSSTILPSMTQRRGSQSSDNLPSIIGGSEPAPSRFTERFSFPEVSSVSGLTMRRKWHSQDTFYPRVETAVQRTSPPVFTVQKQLLVDANSSGLPSAVTHSRRKWSDQESFDLESVALSHAKSQEVLSDNGSDCFDRDSLSSADSIKKLKTPTGHNPLVCPEVITGRPTPRQDRILQNLSSLRQRLLQKQKELEDLIRHPPHRS